MEKIRGQLVTSTRAAIKCTTFCAGGGTSSVQVILLQMAHVSPWNQKKSRGWMKSSIQSLN